MTGLGFIVFALALATVISAIVPESYYKNDEHD